MNGAQGGMVTADNRNLDQPRDALRGNWNDSRTWSECERIGGLLASESLRVIEPAAWQTKPVVPNYSTEVSFPVESNDMWQLLEQSPLKYPHYPDKTVQARGPSKAHAKAGASEAREFRDSGRSRSTRTA